MSIQAKTDLSSAFAGLDKLSELLRTKVARSMGVAAGQVYRDEAKRRAPIGDGSDMPGTLKESIYLAYSDKRTSQQKVVYSISWNSKLAPHGHLIEFGHWRINQLVPIGSGGLWVATTDRLDTPKWMPADPFLRPALDAMGSRAGQAAIERGKARLRELLAGKDAVEAAP